MRLLTLKRCKKKKNPEKRVDQQLLSDYQLKRTDCFTSMINTGNTFLVCVLLSANQDLVTWQRGSNHRRWSMAVSQNPYSPGERRPRRDAKVAGAVLKTNVSPTHNAAGLRLILRHRNWTLLHFW